MFSFINRNSALTIPKEGEAYVREIRAASSVTPSMATMGQNLSRLAVVVDPYSGKYYGESKATDYQDYYKGVIQGIERDLAQVNKTGYAPPPEPSGTQVMGTYLNQAIGKPLSASDKEAYLATKNQEIASANKELMNFQNNYEQKDKMLRSFDTYGDNWNKYFEGNYKNPRQAEANNMQFSSKKGKGTGTGLDINTSNDLKTPKTVGTGIASVGNVNPFGKLDAGLNI